MAALTFAPIDFDEFHTQELPRRIAANGALAASDVDGVGALALRVGERAYTYVSTNGTIEIRPGDEDAKTVVVMDRDTFSDYANELHTCFGLLYGEKATVERGSFGWFERWEPALAPLYHGRPIVDAAAEWTRDDLGRSFTLDDSDADLRAYLDDAGFLHVRGVFGADEIEALRAEVERQKAEATPDDGRSWWATKADGTEVCCRLIYMGLKSGEIAALGDDPRLRRLAALGGDGLEPEIDRIDGQGVVIKNPEITAGLSDLPWHRDCGLGGHPVLCPSVHVGIQLDAATAETGQLHFVAGSHRGSSHPLQPGDEEHLPVVAVDTEPGDVTVHFGHVFHAAPPPTGTGPCRRAMYVTFTRPETLEFMGPMRGYNDVLFTRDGQVHNAEEMIAQV